MCVCVCVYVCVCVCACVRVCVLQSRYTPMPDQIVTGCFSYWWWDLISALFLAPASWITFTLTSSTSTCKASSFSSLMIILCSATDVSRHTWPWCVCVYMYVRSCCCCWWWWGLKLSPMTNNSVLHAVYSGFAMLCLLNACFSLAGVFVTCKK